MNSLRLMSLFAGCLFLGACSSAPAPAPATPPPAAPAAADAATAGAQKPNRVYMEDKTLTNDEVKKLFEQGYKPVSRNGEVYYCKKEQALGTRFATTTCRTADQMKEIERESKALTAEKQRPSGCAAQGAGC
jgi:hypothetical protein